MIDLQKLEQKFCELLDDPNFVADFEQWFKGRNIARNNNKSITVDLDICPIDIRIGNLVTDKYSKLKKLSSDATHWLRCRHCIGRSCKEYFMACIPIGKAKNGKLRVLVFGERYWAGKEGIKRIRYVNECCVIPK